MHLNKEETTTVKICSRLKWNDTGLEILPSEEYYFRATGIWRDANIKCTADGYDCLVLTLAKPFRRAPHEKWFALMGVLDKTGARYLIGRKKTIRFSQKGKLYCYANDLSLFYCNNHDSIELFVKRVQ